MTCDKCLDGRHIHCHGCDCTVCGRGASNAFKAGGTAVKTRPKKATPRAVRVSQQALTTRQANRAKYGVGSDLAMAEIEKIFSLKAAGESISGIARDLDISRDQVRTAYYAPTAPAAGTKGFEPMVIRGGRLTGNEHLDKAKGALDHARELVKDLQPGEAVHDNPSLHKEYLALLDLASVQAAVAQAESLARIAAHLDRRDSAKSSINTTEVSDGSA